MKPKALFMCEVADAEAKRRMQEYVEVIEIDDANVEAILDNLAGKEALIVPYTREKLITRDVIDAGDALKIIGATYGGTRQNIEDEYAIRKGLTVIHTGCSRQRPMAEYALTLILSSLTQVHSYNHHMRSGELWPRRKFGRTRILHGRKVGVVGVGLIGRAIISLLKNFTDDIYVRSSHLTDESAEEMGVKKVSLDGIFELSEVIILSGGYTPETHHLIKGRHFDRMQKDALFVNIARGKMVDQEAMIAALERNDIYLALDVFEQEPLEPESRLRENDRVLITPHRGNAPIEFEQRWQALADEIQRFYTGNRPRTALTLERARTMSAS